MSTGALMRSPISGKILRKKSTHRLRGLTDQTTGCCCDCPHCLGQSVDRYTCAFSAVNLTQGCSPIIYYHWVYIVQNILAGSFTLNRESPGVCIWTYRESPGAHVQADAYYGLYGCAGNPEAHYDFVITLTRNPNGFSLIAYLGLGDAINVVLFQSTITADDCRAPHTFPNQCGQSNNINVPCRGTSGSATITPQL